MKTIFFTLGFILTVCQLNGQSNTVRLSIQPRGSALELSWPGSLRLSSGDLVYPRFQILESPDLNSWQPVGPQLQSTGPAPMTFSVAPARTPWFYRLFAEWAQIALNTPALGGDKVFGYAAAFNEELARIGQISLQAFADRYSYTNGYLPAIDWDPTTARYWNLFAADP